MRRCKEMVLETRLGFLGLLSSQARFGKGCAIDSHGAGGNALQCIILKNPKLFDGIAPV